MNRQLKQRWIEALRSGQYAQGEGQLKYESQGRETQYCCLGVLGCAVMGRAVKDIDGTDLDADDPNAYGEYEPNTLLGDEFREEIGLLRFEQDLLSSINDGHVSQFKLDRLRREYGPEIAQQVIDRLHILWDTGAFGDLRIESFDHDFNAIADVIEILPLEQHS